MTKTFKNSNKDFRVPFDMELILPLPYYEGRRSDDIIIRVQSSLQSLQRFGLREISEQQIDSIQVSVGLTSFVFLLDAVSKRNDTPVEYLNVHATASNKQL